jgi:hypothetical protein
VLAELLATGELAELAGLFPELAPEQAARPGMAIAVMTQAAVRPGFMATPLGIRPRCCQPALERR